MTQLNPTVSISKVSSQLFKNFSCGEAALDVSTQKVEVEDKLNVYPNLSSTSTF